MGVKIDQIYAHVTTSAVIHQYAKCDNHMRACSRDISEVVTVELENLLRVKTLPILERPETKRSPIEGLNVIEGLLICDWDGCSSGYTTPASLRKHRSTAHKEVINKTKRGTHRTGHCQTLYISPASYFEVEGPVFPSTGPQSLEHTFDLSAFLHDRKTEMLHNQHSKPQPINPQLIPPPFVELGFYTFITSLVDQNSIPSDVGHGKHETFSLLRKLVVQCFQEDCEKLEHAPKSIREAIMENPPWYVCSFKLILVVDPRFNTIPTGLLFPTCLLTPHSYQQHRLHMLLLKLR